MLNDPKYRKELLLKVLPRFDQLNNKKATTIQSSDSGSKKKGKIAIHREINDGLKVTNPKGSLADS